MQLHSLHLGPRDLLIQVDPGAGLLRSNLLQMRTYPITHRATILNTQSKLMVIKVGLLKAGL